MASQSLYRKWRSQTFSELVGQAEIVKTLKNALSSGKISHAYLFTGPRGTGKTSTARLLAKTINCPNAHNGEPCNECSQCRDITNGSSFNVIEIDAASNRGIDSIRELREKVMMPPTTGKYKVYILDEAHMLTNEAFNALLKTLEEPPAHVIFVMATTDVHKMLPTVLSRCQRFDFKRITTRQIVEHLNFVAQEEQVHLGKGAAELIARAASGGMRDALSLLDQAIAYSGQEVALEQVQAMLGVADPRAIQNLVLHVANLDSANGLHLINELVEAGADLHQTNTQIADYWRAMMLTKAGANIATILDSTDDEVHEVIECTRLFTLEELTECARVFAQNELMQKNQGTPQLGLELAFLSCTELHRRTQTGQSTAPAAAATPPAQTRPAANPAPTYSRPTSPAPASRPTPPPARTEPEIPGQTTTAPTPLAEPTRPVVTPPAQDPPHTPVVGTTPTPATPAASEPDWDDISYHDDEEALAPLPALVELDAHALPAEQTNGAHVAPAHDAPTLTVQQVKENWENIKKRVKSKRENIKESSTVSALLRDFSPVAVEGTATHTVLVFRAGYDFQYKQMIEKDRDKLLQWAIKLEFGLECQIKLLSPNQAYTLPPQSDRTTPLVVQDNDNTSYSANSALAVTPRQPAYREPPPNISSFEKKAASRPPKAENAAPARPANETAPPLVRLQVVRENKEKVFTTSASDGPNRLDAAKSKAQADPVVQEVERIFKATIQDIHLK